MCIAIKKHKKMSVEKIIVNNEEYLINIYFEDRPNTSVSINQETINVRIPLNMSREEQFRQVIKMKQWVIKKLTKNSQKFLQQEIKQYQHGDKLKINQDEFLLNIIYSDKKSSSSRMIDNNIFLDISNNLTKEQKHKHISSLLSRTIASKKLQWLKDKINKLNDTHFQMPLKSISFKHQKSRWGSCSSQGKINISTRLLFAPEDVIDSVCIHELAHLKEQNHSEQFWKLVEKAMPDYKEKQKWLKENWNKCTF